MFSIVFTIIGLVVSLFLLTHTLFISNKRKRLKEESKQYIDSLGKQLVLLESLLSRRPVKTDDDKLLKFLKTIQFDHYVNDEMKFNIYKSLTEHSYKPTPKGTFIHEYSVEYTMLLKEKIRKEIELAKFL